MACFLRGRADPGSSLCLPTVPSALFTPEVHAGGEGEWRDSILLSPWKSFPAPEVYRKKGKDRMPCRTRSSSPRILSPRGSMTLTWNLLLQRLFHGPKIIPLEGLFVLEDNLGLERLSKSTVFVVSNLNDFSRLLGPRNSLQLNSVSPHYPWHWLPCLNQIFFLPSHSIFCPLYLLPCLWRFLFTSYSG